MKIYLLSNDIGMTTAWEFYFGRAKNVSVAYDEFCHFMELHHVECVVSPANSFGLMDGGYDAAITKWFGDKLQEKVQDYITKNYYGEQPVGSSFIIETPQRNVKLIHTPTMRLPERIIDDSVIYHCMRTCLMTALQNEVKSIVIPAFGALTGGINCETVAKMMWMAYVQINSEHKEISWEHAWKSHFREN